MGRNCSVAWKALVSRMDCAVARRDLTRTRLRFAVTVLVVCVLLAACLGFEVVACASLFLPVVCFFADAVFFVF
jgi:uncharacterized membrane protein YtjA (UPF0391 family)